MVFLRIESDEGDSLRILVKVPGMVHYIIGILPDLRLVEFEIPGHGLTAVIRLDPVAVQGIVPEIRIDVDNDFEIRASALDIIYDPVVIFISDEKFILGSSLIL